MSFRLKIEVAHGHTSKKTGQWEQDSESWSMTQFISDVAAQSCLGLPFIIKAVGERMLEQILLQIGVLKKYALHPGKVLSINDEETHFITAQQLVKLYGLQKGEYVIWDRQYWGREDEFIHLGPRYDGNYSDRRCFKTGKKND